MPPADLNAETPPELAAARVEQALGVLIAVHHPMLRSALSALVGGEHGLHAVAVVQDVLNAARELRRHRPHLLLIDRHLAWSGKEPVIDRLRAMAPETAVLVTGMGTGPDYVAASRAAGAAGYVPADAPVERLLQEIRAAAVRI